ncbi:DUF732 domain-containing protein [Mycolicibacterium cosmeticum]|uniref:DUF732 domain-containing protein n=1 Tax=Mycolicibacterium cosmeticum TaxID=258533 RepID=W9BK28_MYCCO|nr:DUF732 domain-containing protein [Mycolicibacterium cosmeticum]CDO07380.1 hypothetical protein BN977_02187 [Mycolicibacterium cosmeticum]
MTIKRTLAAAVLAAGAMTALAAPAAADDGTDQKFLMALEQLKINVGGDAKAISVAHSACQVLFHGKPLSYALYSIKNQTDLSDDQATKFGGAALRMYCPKYLP